MSRLWKKAVWFYKKRGLTALVRKIFCKSLQNITAFAVNHTVYARWYISGRSKMFAEMKDDPRFTLSDGWLRGLLNRPAKNYRITTVKLRDLKHCREVWDNETVFLQDTPTFAYIVNGDEQRYREYVRAVCEYVSVMDETFIPAVIEDNIAGVQKTIESITNDGYDLSRFPIIVDDKNFILDGLHRSSILWKQFGPEHEITVLKIYYSRLFDDNL